MSELGYCEHGRPLTWTCQHCRAKESNSRKVAASTVTDEQAEIRALRAKLQAAEEELGDWREGAKSVLEHNRPHDEYHCTCVPILRRELLQRNRDIVLLLSRAEAAEAKVARLTQERDQWKGVFDRSQDDEAALRTRIAELEAGLREIHETAMWALEESPAAKREGRGINPKWGADLCKALLGEGE